MRTGLLPVIWLKSDYDHTAQGGSAEISAQNRTFVICNCAGKRAAANRTAVIDYLTGERAAFDNTFVAGIAFVVGHLAGKPGAAGAGDRTSCLPRYAVHHIPSNFAVVGVQRVYVVHPAAAAVCRAVAFNGTAGHGEAAVVIDTTAPGKSFIS